MLTEKQQKDMATMMDSLQTGKVSTSELVMLTKALLSLFNDIKRQLLENIKNTDIKLRYDLNSVLDELKSLEKKMTASLGEASGRAEKMTLVEVSKLTTKMQKDMEKMHAMIPTMPDLSAMETRMKTMEAMEMPKEKDIIEAIENKLPQLGTKIRDGLELINEESEKLRIEAVGNLRKELDELKKQKSTFVGGRGGGGVSVGALNFHLVDDITPTGTVNGTNTIFTLANIPSPTTSLRVYVNGQRMTLTEDFTLSNNTITFVIAPPTGSIIRCDYRT